MARDIQCTIVDLTTLTLRVLDSRDKAVPQRGVFAAAPRPWNGKDYGKLVSLLGDAVGELGDALAVALGEKK